MSRRLAVLLLLASCGGQSIGPTPFEPELVSAVPGSVARLELVDQATGRPAVERDRGTRPAFTIAFEDIRSDLELIGLTWAEAPDGADGVFVALQKGGGAERSVVWTNASFPAASASGLALTGRMPRGSAARVFFRTAADEESGLRTGFRASSFLDALGTSGHDLRFPAAGHPDWKGEITALRIDLPASGQPIRLDEISAFYRELEPGSSPLRRGDEQLDNGLVELGFEHPTDSSAARYVARRSFPAFEGAVQVARVDVSDGARLDFAYGLPVAVERVDGTVEFEVFSRTRGGDPQALFAASLDPERDARRWFPASVELAASAEPLELLFRTRGGAPEGVHHGLWASPRLVGGGERRDSVILITADTLRADHLGAYGNEDLTTPAIDALAERGVRFTDCLSVSNTTSPAHATLLTGLYPRDHGVTTNRLVLPDAITTLAEAFAATGRLTIASSGVQHLNADISGFGQGFDAYVHAPPAWFVNRETDEITSRRSYRYADRIHEDLFELLDELGDAPFFAWLHYYDPHTPYAPAETWRERRGLASPADEGERDALDELLDRRLSVDADYGSFRPRNGEPFELSRQKQRQRLVGDYRVLDFLDEERDVEVVRELYRAEIEELDHDLGQLFGKLADLGRGDDTLIVFTADHGESLGEREIWFDHIGLYENTLRIPLVLAGPGLPAGRVVEEPVSGIDVAATLADLFDLELPDALGSSLVPTWAGDAPAFAPDRTRWFQHGNGWEVGYRRGDEHGLLSLQRHVRDLTGRPIEAGLLEVSEGADEAAARERLEQWLSEALDFEQAQPATLNAAEEQALEALGYAGD